MEVDVRCILDASIAHETLLNDSCYICSGNAPQLSWFGINGNGKMTLTFDEPVRFVRHESKDLLNTFYIQKA